MSNTLKQPYEISPHVLDATKADTVGAVFGLSPADWFSAWFSPEGVPHGSSEVSVMLYVDWQGATQIDLLPQYKHRLGAHPADDKGTLREEATLPIPEFDGARLNSAFEVEQDTISLLAANFRTDPGSVELPLEVIGISQVRFMARATGGTPVLRMQVLAGGD